MSSPSRLPHRFAVSSALLSVALLFGCSGAPKGAQKAPAAAMSAEATRLAQDLTADARVWNTLATLLEPRALYVPFMYPIWLHFGPQKGPQNRSKIDQFLNLFLNDFLEPLFHAFGLHLGSQNETKKDPKRKHKNHRFCYYLLHLGHMQGSRKSSFLVLFRNPF